MNQFDRRDTSAAGCARRPYAAKDGDSKRPGHVRQVAVALVEIYFLARLGVDVLAGVSLVFPVLAWVGAVSQGAVGGGVVTGHRSRARPRRPRARRQAGMVRFGVGRGVGLLTTVVILWIGPRFYAGMGAQGASLSRPSPILIWSLAAQY